MNNDVVQEILLHLAVQTLLRFRAVSKSWRDVIDSPSFRKLHTHNDNNSRSTVGLKFNLPRSGHCTLSIKLLDNGKSFTLPHNLDNLLPWSSSWRRFSGDEYVEFVGPVKGLICIYSALHMVPIIAICNPFLGQFKILPESPFTQCRVHRPDYGIGFDGDDYKVVELVFCFDHGHYHARVYSGRTDSWRELAGDGVFDQIRNRRGIRPVKSTSKNGEFAHWMADRVSLSFDMDRVLLSFDMRNEVFRATKIDGLTTDQILTIDGEAEGSFVLFYTSGNLLEIYEKGRDLHWRKYWMPMVNLEEPWLWKRGSHYVVVKNVNWRIWRMRGKREVSLYDYCARKFVGKFELSENSEIIEYIGSFISLE